MVQLSRNFHFKSIIHVAVLQPQCRRNDIGLGSSPFDRHYLGNHYCFLFLRLLRCFSSPGSPPCKQGSLVFNQGGCPIRKSPDRRLFAPPRSLSQLVTSFIASESQGIRHALLITFLPKVIVYLWLLDNHRITTLWMSHLTFIITWCILFLSICQRTSSPMMSGMVENIGFEPMTPCVQGRCSSQLS